MIKFVIITYLASNFLIYEVSFGYFVEIQRYCEKYVKARHPKTTNILLTTVLIHKKAKNHKITWFNLMVPS